MKAYYAANKEIHKARTKEYNSRNREALAVKKKQYTQSHKPDQAVRSRRWYKANRAKALQQAKDRAEKSRAAIAEYKRKYYKENREAIRNEGRAHYSANKDAYAETNRRWAKANPDAVRAIKIRNKANRKGAIGSFSKAEWVALKRRFNNRCVCCGRRHSKDDPTSKITADHVVPLALGGTNYIGNLQPLCAHCNSSKSAHNTADYRGTPFTGIAQLALIS